MVFFKVGLNTKQNSPAADCSAKQNSIVKLNLNSTEIAPVGIKCEKSRHQRKDAKRAEKMRKEPCFMEEKQTLLYHAYRTKFRSH